jgi:hypothetical protein
VKHLKRLRVLFQAEHCSDGNDIVLGSHDCNGHKEPPVLAAEAVSVGTNKRSQCTNPSHLIPCVESQRK